MRVCLECLDQTDGFQLSPGLLCEIANVGERTLQYAFRERFGVSPGAFLKARRLMEVRKQLIQTHDDHRMIGEVAASVGFWHVGQLAADYRHAFGETPSETLKRVRRD
jgi:AraC family ethanolamine operon transcriptional activator